MTSLDGVVPPQPLVRYRHLCLALSRERLGAYSLPTDHDSTDAIARYLWNLSLASALWPSFHLLEIAFRNALFDAGKRATADRDLRFGVVSCWLDTHPSLLAPQEAQEVRAAIEYLGAQRRRQTAGHLVSQLGLGFWVRLCNSPYEHGNRHGPRLWPEACHRFPNCPKPKRNRADIRAAFGEIAQWRNELAHHQPVWDRDPVTRETRALELLGWMNAPLSAAVAYASHVGAIYQAGPARYRRLAEALVSV